MIDKIYIKDQIELNRLPALLEEADELEYFRSIIEEISARDYAGVVNVSYDSKISLAMLNKFLDRMARELFKLDQMPKSCEIATLQLMVSTRAEGKNLINFYGARQLDEQEVTKLYFMVFSTESNENILDMIYDLQLRKMMDYIWDKGLLRFFNNRYLKLETARDDDLSINSVIEAVGLPAVFDESGLIQRYAEESTEESSEKVDFKENFYLENKRKSKALTVLHRIYDMLDEYPCDFKRLREMMLSLNMDSEVGKIEYDGIKSLRDYIRSKGVVGAHEVAKRYDLVFPALAGESLAHARSIINTYFYSQARNTRKGRFFLRSEVIYNLQSSVHSGRCYRFPGGCLLAIIRTKDNDEHYIFGRYPSGLEQEIFTLNCIGNFLFLDSHRKAASRIVYFYMENLAGDIRMKNATKRMLFAFPLVLSLGILVGLLYYLAVGGTVAAMMVGVGIMLLGTGIAAKNGFDEEVTQESSDKIPGCLNRTKGQIAVPSVEMKTQPDDLK